MSYIKLGVSVMGLFISAQHIPWTALLWCHTIAQVYIPMAIHQVVNKIHLHNRDEFFSVVDILSIMCGLQLCCKHWMTLRMKLAHLAFNTFGICTVYIYKCCCYCISLVHEQNGLGDKKILAFGMNRIFFHIKLMEHKLKKLEVFSHFQQVRYCIFISWLQNWLRILMKNVLNLLF
jgi:hypothetical protein